MRDVQSQLPRYQRKAAQTMDRVDTWRAGLAMKTLRRDQREAIATVAED